MYYGDGVRNLAEQWRAHAATLREYGAEVQAVALEKCADALSTALDQQEVAPLTLQEAAELGGYSAEHLGRLVRQGKIPNAGRKGAPRIARKDVPIKAGRVVQKPQTCEIDFTQIVRSAIEEGAA